MVMPLPTPTMSSISLTALASRQAEVHMLDSHDMILWTLVATLLAIAAEVLHLRRIRRLKTLAFPLATQHSVARIAPLARIIGVALICYGCLGIISLTQSEENVDSQPHLNRPDPQNCKHLLILLDVSPSMGINDAGIEGNTPRYIRAADILASVLQRIERKDILFSLVGFYTDVRPVLVETYDRNVILNVASCRLDLTFRPGKTKLDKALKGAFELAAEREWPAGSTSVLILTDGDTTPPETWSEAPDAIERIMVAGIGSQAGKFLDDHQSRQDSGALNQIATRYSAPYVDVNQVYFPTGLLSSLTGTPDSGTKWALNWHTAFLLFIACGSLLLAGATPALRLFSRSRL